VAVGGFSTGGDTSGSASTGALTQTSHYQINCAGTSSYVSAMATVTVLQPIISISANPTRITTNTGTTEISWSSSNVRSCAVTKNGTAWKTGLAATTTDSNLETQTIYKLTCQTRGNPISKSAIVNVTPGFKEF